MIPIIGYYVCNIQVHLLWPSGNTTILPFRPLAVPEWGATEGEVVGPETTHQLVG